MRAVLLGMLAAAACSCSQSEDRRTAVDGEDAEPRHAALEQLVAKAFGEYDRQVEINCACFAEMGAYPSAEKCIELTHSRPDWVGCATRAVAHHDSAEFRQRARCYLEQQTARSECLESTSCGSDERVACAEIQRDCTPLETELTLLISVECPDTSILPRLNTDAGA